MCQKEATAKQSGHWERSELHSWSYKHRAKEYWGVDGYKELPCSSRLKDERS